MKAIFILLYYIPLLTLAHPGIGIVTDSKGNIYYTDLVHVWKIANGQRSVVVRNVHTHELYIDRNDNLYGEHVSGGSDYSSTWYHYMWMLHPNGKLDTVVKQKQAYVTVDFSIARDHDGNEYYTRQFIKQRDTNHIYKKYPDGREVVLATGKFDKISWLHPQKDGSVLFVMKNTIYSIEANGKVDTIAANIASGRSSFEYLKNSKTVWGLWQDDARNIYAAVFSDQVIIKINADGERAIVYRSPARWMPVHGVFDKKGKLWVMETSDKNDIRVVDPYGPGNSELKEDSSLLIWILPVVLGIAGVFVLIFILLRRPRLARER